MSPQPVTFSGSIFLFGNVGSIVSFRVGQRDAEVLEREFGGAYLAGHFTRLSNYEICVKMLTSGETSEPFVGKTSPPVGRRHGKYESIVNRSRDSYSVRRGVIEGKIRRWLQRRA